MKYWPPLKLKINISIYIALIPPPSLPLRPFIFLLSFFLPFFHLPYFYLPPLLILSLSSYSGDQIGTSCMLGKCSTTESTPERALIIFFQDCFVVYSIKNMYRHTFILKYHIFDTIFFGFQPTIMLSLYRNKVDFCILLWIQPSFYICMFYVVAFLQIALGLYKMIRTFSL